MERRGFLKTLFGGAAAAVAGTMLDPEKLLWVPGAKTIFLPAGDIAIKNVRAATMAEQAQITGEHLLRIKYRAAKSNGGIVLLGESKHSFGGSLRVEEAVVVPEKLFATSGLSLLEGATDIEVHFDDGTVAHGVKVASTLAEIREKAQQNQRNQAARQAQQDRGRLPQMVAQQRERKYLGVSFWSSHEVQWMSDKEDKS